jgi:hypothetical protein
MALLLRPDDATATVELYHFERSAGIPGVEPVSTEK